MSAKVFALPARKSARPGRVPKYVARLAGRGKALPASVRRYMEPRFGASFSNVRVHNDREAAASATSINARAYTFGRDVVFSEGQYAPETAAGRRLIAHELAHVVQQRAGGATAQRVMRSPFPGCDKATTGVDDADARIKNARKQADDILTVARGKFPRMDTRTLTLVDGHFHCPTHSDLMTIIETLGKIQAGLASVQPTCVDSSKDFCDAAGQVDSGSGIAELCPVVFGAGNKAFRFAGFMIDAAAQVAGIKNTCFRRDACYGDFTKPGADMVGNAISYTALSVELAGHKLHSFATIPCAPTDTGTLVDVTPEAVKDPSKIRPHSGMGAENAPPTPAGTAILSVFRDQSGNRFIYHQSIAGAAVFTAKDAEEKPPRKRFYLSP